MIICHCMRVSDTAIDAAIASGAGTVSEVTERCLAGGGCGTCWPSIEALVASSAGRSSLPVGLAA